jgi:8-oxo-dGTP pyrophosphatase MutT (NUDIX family)
VWQGEGAAARLAVIHRPRHADWALPKGKLQDGESFPTAAIREVAEETACRVRLGEFAGYALYRTKRGTKLALFWHMAARRVEPLEPNDEVDRVEWLTPDEALARLAHPEERRLVRTAVAARALVGARRRASGS